MEQWAEEVNFDDRGEFLGLHQASQTAAQNSRHDSSNADGGATVSSRPEQRTALGTTTTATTTTTHNSVVSSQWPMMATPTPSTTQEHHATHAATLAPCFETYLGIPPAFIFQCARTRTDATLLYDVTCIAMEMDVVMESVGDQLHDRHKIGECLYSSSAANTKQAPQTMMMETTLLVLQRKGLDNVRIDVFAGQAHDVNASNLLLLLKRFQECLQKLHDLQFPLAQSIENNVNTADELEELGDADGAAVRRKLAQVQAGLLERLQMLQDAEAIPLTSKLVTSTEFQHQHMRNNVCWPVASNSDESKRSTMDDVRLSSSSGFMHSCFSASASSSEERRLMDAEDPSTTRIGHHDGAIGEAEGGDEEHGQHPGDLGVSKGGHSSQKSDNADHDSRREDCGRSEADREAQHRIDSHDSSSEHVYSESVY